MAVAFDNKGLAAHAFGVTTLTTATFTVGSGANRAGALLLTVLASSTGVTGTIAGVSGAAVTGTTQTTAGQLVTILGVIAPASGAGKTGVCSWTTAGSATLTALTATSVDQTTPCNNGTLANVAFATSVSKAITSVSGDLTFSVGSDANGSQLPTTNQTSETADTWTGCDIGPGTGTTTHTWSCGSATAINLSGANFKAASGSTFTGGLLVAN